MFEHSEQSDRPVIQPRLNGSRRASISDVLSDYRSSVAQFKGDDSSGVPLQAASPKGGLPQQLKSGLESISGLSLDDVRVHRNSDFPAQLSAFAFTQGSDIYVGPGQDKYLPHEGWHAVQQKQGRVQPTRQLAAGPGLNDQVELEHEADIMGQRAASFSGPEPEALVQAAFYDDGPVQCAFDDEEEELDI